MGADILPFLKGQTFDDAATRAMGEAFDKARRFLHDRGQPAVVQELIAKQIIVTASSGERDSDRLARKALEALGLPAQET